MTAKTDKNKQQKGTGNGKNSHKQPLLQKQIPCGDDNQGDNSKNTENPSRSGWGSKGRT
jgi:hypothetical protein